MPVQDPNFWNRRRRMRPKGRAPEAFPEPPEAGASTEIGHAHQIVAEHSHLNPAVVAGSICARPVSQLIRTN